MARQRLFCSFLSEWLRKTKTMYFSHYAGSFRQSWQVYGWHFFEGLPEILEGSLWMISKALKALWTSGITMFCLPLQNLLLFISRPDTTSATLYVCVCISMHARVPACVQISSKYLLCSIFIWMDAYDLVSLHSRAPLGSLLWKPRTSLVTFHSGCARQLWCLRLRDMSLCCHRRLVFAWKE